MNTFSIKKLDKRWYVCRFSTGKKIKWRKFLDGFKACLGETQGRYLPDERAWLAKGDELGAIRKWVDSQHFDAVIWLHRNLEHEFRLESQYNQLAKRCKLLIKKVHELRGQPPSHEFGVAPAIQQPNQPLPADLDGIDILIRECQGLIDSQS